MLPYKYTPAFKTAVWPLFLSIILLNSCSMLGPVYLRSGYSLNSMDTIRDIKLIVQEPELKPGISRLLLDIAADHIRVRKNYTVSSKQTGNLMDPYKCDKPDGHLIISVDNLAGGNSYVDIYVSGKMFRCRDNLLIWRGEGRYKGVPGDGRLKSMIRIYRRDHGKIADLYTEPLYFLLKDILETLPDPQPVKK